TPYTTLFRSEPEAMPTSELIGSEQSKLQSELQWRLSMPILVLVVTLIAVPLSRVSPRQGRFLKLLPAILMYMSYLALLIAARGGLDKGRIPAGLGLWPVHGVFALIGVLLVYWQPLQLRLAQRRAAKAQGVQHG